MTVRPERGKHLRRSRGVGRNRQRQLGQFFTPLALVVFTLELLEALGAPGDESSSPLRVVDPAAGDGIFLRELLARWGSRRKVHGLGVDLDPTLSFHTLALPGGTLELCQGQGLLDHPNWGLNVDAFDMALGNPPFGGRGLKTEVQDHSLGSGAVSGQGGAASEALHEVTADRERSRLLEQLLEQSELFRWSQGWGASTPQQALEFGKAGRSTGRVGAVRKGLSQPLRQPLRSVARLRPEVLFLERFVQLVRPGGWVAIILPEGLFANARWHFVRTWLATQGTVLALVGFSRAFVQTGAAARTTLLVFRKGVPQNRQVLIADAGAEWIDEGPPELQALEPCLAALLEQAAAGVGSAWYPAELLRGPRWDPQLLCSEGRSPLAPLPEQVLAPLGTWMEHITYGPIVTGSRASDDPGDVVVIGQRQFEASGLNLLEADRVTRHGRYDPPRSRVRCGDLLFPRSGVGSLGKNRVAVYEEVHEANVSCFVDRIRLRGINPYYVSVYLRTRFGWGQIRRLIHGVGTPNLSFDEIRSLQIVRAGAALQEETETRYREQVGPLHRALVEACAKVRGVPEGSPSRQAAQELRQQAEQAVQQLAAWLEGMLEQGNLDREAKIPT